MTAGILLPFIEGLMKLEVLRLHRRFCKIKDINKAPNLRIWEELKKHICIHSESPFYNSDQEKAVL